MTAPTALTSLRFMTVAEVSALMRVSKMTVYRLLHDGELEGHRVGRSFRVEEQSVTRYLASIATGASAAPGTGDGTGR